MYQMMIYVRNVLMDILSLLQVFNVLLKFRIAQNIVLIQEGFNALNVVVVII